MTGAAPAVHFDRVTKRYGEQIAIDRVTLSLARERVTALVGESGSGKSTLLQLVNGLLRPDTGRVSVMDRAIDYHALPALRRRIGYAVQGIGLFPHLDVGDNIALLARLVGWPASRIRQRRARLLGLMQLDAALLQRFPHQLSGGQQQRAGLCRAMMLEPPLLLLDEPFSGVDPITRGRIHERFLALQRDEPRSVVLVTHDLREARRLGDDIVIVREGRVLQYGPTDEVLRSPADDYVATLFRAQLR